MVVSLVHNQAMYNVGESALLKRCAISFEVLEETIQNSMAGGEKLVSTPDYDFYQFILELEFLVFRF